MEPTVVLAAWAAGLAAGSALVIRWAVVGKGYTRLTLGVTILLGASTAAAGGGGAAWVGCGLAAVAVFTLRTMSVLLAAAAALSFLVAGEGDVLLLITGALFLGGVTCEMLLGHWYLVDPRLPRSALRRLSMVGLGGALVDPISATVLGASAWGGTDTVTGIGWIVLAAASVLLMIGVWFSLGEKGYPAVMAATGLSYLAVLTAIGTVVLGRVLVSGTGLR